MTGGVDTFPARRLNARNQCCGRKPLVYKRPPHLFCHRCCASYDPATGQQIANWAWLAAESGFVPKYPATGGYLQYVRKVAP